MKPSIQTLGQILYSPSQYVIPVFQRNYRWERPQWEKLWESLIDVQAPDKRGNHFMGFLVFVPGLAQPGQHTSFHLIDGQQRLTTSSLLLIAIRNVARQIDQADLADEIQQYYLIHPLKKGDQHYRLLPKQSDYANYLAVVNGLGKATGRVAGGVAFFEEKLLEEAEENAGRLREIYNSACQRLEFMCATLEAENAYNIFKSLNSTGVPLDQSDLIRNFVFMHVPPHEHDEFNASYWLQIESHFKGKADALDEDRFSKFFRDFLMAKGRYFGPRETFSSFESRYESTGFAPVALSNELLINVHFYDVILGKGVDESSKVTDSLVGLNKLESSTTYPLLLSLFERRSTGEIDSGQLAECIQMLRGFILRRYVCGESSRGYGQMFVRALAKQEVDTVPSLEGYLLDRGWPEDKRFEEALVGFPLYEREYAREILEGIERSRGHKEPADLMSATVEHILPQTLSQAWIEDLGDGAEQAQLELQHRLGNLTLSAYNIELWNHPFKKKRERYEQSNIVITRELIQHDKWGRDEIQARGRRLAKEAASIWKGPKAGIRQSAAEAELGEEGSAVQKELRLKFWTGFSDYLIAERPELPRFTARPRRRVRFPSGLSHIGFETMLRLKHDVVRADVWFWREASFPLWERIKSNPEDYNELTGVAWEFDQPSAQFRARMSVSRNVPNLREPSRWPEQYEWLGATLSRLYDKVAPKLQADIDGLK